MLSKKSLAFAATPLLAAAFPVLSLFSSNVFLLEFDVTRILPSLGVALAGAAVVYLAVLAALRSPSRASVLAAVVVSYLFLYRAVHALFWYALVGDGEPAATPIDPYTSALLCYWIGVALLAIGVLVAARRRTDWETGARVAAVILASIVAVTVVQILWQRATWGAAARSSDTAAASGDTSRPRPDIYYVILDGYARSDVVQTLFGVDNRPFVAALEQRGFFVAKRSRSNYLLTALSLASSLNYDYIPPPPGRVRGERYRHDLMTSAQNGKAVGFLRDLGYTYVSVGMIDGNEYADTSIRAPLSLGNEFEFMLLEWTPFRELFVDTEYEALVDKHRARIAHGIEGLALASDLPSPKFVFAHIVCPHAPFVYGADGGRPVVKLPPTIHEGKHFFKNASGFVQASPEDLRGMYRKGYSDQLQYVSREILGAVDAILARSDPASRPVIIIQADHGSGLYYDHDTANQPLLWERSGILNAWLVPDTVRPALSDDMTPVNTFRILFDGLFDADLPLLPNRTYFVEWDAPAGHVELTEEQLRPPGGR